MEKSWKTSEGDFEMDTAGPTGELMRLRLSVVVHSGSESVSTSKPGSILESRRPSSSGGVVGSSGGEATSRRSFSP